MKNKFENDINKMGQPLYSNLPMDRVYAVGNVLRKSSENGGKKTSLQRIGAIFMAFFLLIIPSVCFLVIIFALYHFSLTRAYNESVWSAIIALIYILIPILVFLLGIKVIVVNIKK